MATDFTTVSIGGVDYSDDTLHIELWRNINSVGSFMAILRNTGGQYNNTFDVQDEFYLNVDGAANTIFQGVLDGPAVTMRGKDNESIWDEYIILRGVDQAQDLLFHNDFEHSYPDIGGGGTSQRIGTIWNDVINARLTTNITYVDPGGTTVVGSYEFHEGMNFLAQTQTLFRTAGYIFYVDDNRVFRSGAPGFVGSASGVTLYSFAGNPTNNIIDVVDVARRDGDKHYNYIKLYGKNPMFDGYTEGNASEWTIAPNGGDTQVRERVGQYSQVAYNNDPVDSALTHDLDTPANFYHDVWDLSKGEIGVWAYYDNKDEAPGSPGIGNAAATMRLGVRLEDTSGNLAYYFGESSRLYEEEWGWCSFKIGERNRLNAVGTADEWCVPLGDFDWNNVRQMNFSLPRHGLAVGAGTTPSHLYLDGLSIPEPCISIVQNADAQLAYRRRPYIDYYTHIRTQNALNAAAEELLEQFQGTSVRKINLVTTGTSSLRYAGQTVTIDVPSLGFSSELCYMTALHHVIEPYSDVSGGFGHDWVTEVEAIPTGGTAYDLGRLRTGAFNSGYQKANTAGTGLRIK